MWNNFDSGMQSSDAGYMDDSRMDTTTDEDKKGGKRADNLVPVMIGHLTSSGQELLLHGEQVRVVTIVGLVRSIDQVTTKITYVIEDETGIVNNQHQLSAPVKSQDAFIQFILGKEQEGWSRQLFGRGYLEHQKVNEYKNAEKCAIKAIKWNSPEDESDTKEQILNINSYVRVYGLPREQDGEKHLLILRICHLDSLNELSNHLLEVVYVAQAGNHTQCPVKKIGAVADTTAAMQNLEFAGMDKDQAIVFNVITGDDSESGIEREQIKKKVPISLVSKVDEILEFLAGEGHIYTTRTDNHFKAT